MDGRVCNVVKSIYVFYDFILGVFKLGFINILKNGCKMFIIVYFWEKGDFNGVYELKKGLELFFRYFLEVSFKL